MSKIEKLPVLLSFYPKAKTTISDSFKILQYHRQFRYFRYSKIDKIIKKIPIECGSLYYTQYPIIRNSAELLGKFKKRALSGSNLWNASKNLKKQSVLRFLKLRNKQYLSFVCNFIFLFIFYSWVVNSQHSVLN